MKHNSRETNKIKKQIKYTNNFKRDLNLNTNNWRYIQKSTEVYALFNAIATQKPKAHIPYKQTNKQMREKLEKHTHIYIEIRHPT